MVDMAANKKTIYVLDDQEDILYLIKEVLEYEFSDSITVKTFKEPMYCMGDIKKQIPDLLLLDIFMPVTNGFKFLKLIRNIGINVPVIIISGFEWARKTADAAVPQNHIEGMLTKPFDNKKLLELVKKVLGSPALV